jgi:hypothetical protein
VNKRKHERAIFAAFLRVAPRFCGEDITTWTQPEDEKEFPDVICTSKSGLKVGVELGEWLNEDEMRHAKGKERIESSILAALGDQGDNNTQNIFLVFLSPRQKARIKLSDAEAFRRQLFECIRDHDERWPTKRFWHSPQGHMASGTELTLYPVVAKYLDGVRMFPNKRYQGRPPDGGMVKETWPAGQDWILFPTRGGAYSEQTMLQPLLELLAEKKGHYGPGSGYDHLSLVVYYNSALLYNSPAETRQFTFENAAEAARRLLEDDAEPFQSIYLFAAADEGRVFKVC